MFYVGGHTPGWGEASQALTLPCVRTPDQQ
jgi:hypothetical protein